MGALLLSMVVLAAAPWFQPTPPIAGAGAAGDAGRALSETPDCPVPPFNSAGGSADNWAQHHQAWLERNRKCEQEQYEATSRRNLEEAQRAAADSAARLEKLEKERKELEAQQAAGEAARVKAEAPLVAELNKIDGYQTARWGMSPAKVKGLFPKSVRQENKLAVHAPVAGFPATIIFFFAQDQLKTALVAFEHTNKVGSNDELFVTLGKALAEKYGSPETLSPPLGTAVGWRGSKTAIVLRNSTAAVNLGSAAEIQYDSVALHDLIQSVSAKAKKDL